MHILYVSPYYWPEIIGSAPYTARLAEHLRDSGHQVTVFAFRPHYPNSSAFTAWADGSRDDEVHEGIRILRVPAMDRGGGGFLTRVLNDSRFMLTLLWAVLSGRIRRVDAIVCYVPSTLGLIGARIAKWMLRAPLIAVVHDIESGLASALSIARGKVFLALMQAAERFGLNGSDRVVVSTTGMVEEVKRIGVRRPIEILPIWAELPPEIARPPSDGYLLMYSGNFGKKQNLDQLIPLIRLLDQRRKDVTVRLQGEGSERARLQSVLEGMGVSNTVFAPLAGQSEFLASIASADAHLVPQAHNVANYALPSKIISIMSVGRPFVCVADPGTTLDALAIDSGAGLCVAPGDDEALFSAIDDLLSVPGRADAMGGKGREYVSKHMSAEAVLRRYEEIIVQSTG